MVDREQLRRLVLSKSFRRTILALLIALVAWFFYRSLEQGSTADRCADDLLRAATAKDRAYLTAHVKNPSLADDLLAAASVELAFVRPVDPEWSRIGFAVKATASATVAQPVFVLLSHRRPDCSFIQDYESK